MNLKELLASLIAEYKTIQTAHPEGMPEAEFEKAKGVLKQIENVKEQIQMADQFKAHEDFATKPAEPPKAASTGWTPDNTTPEKEPAYDGKAWREVEVKTPYGVVIRRYNVPLATETPDYKNGFDKFIRTKGNMNALTMSEQKAMSEGSDDDGGFLVPPEYLNRIIAEETKRNVIRGLAFVFTTGKDIVQMPKIVDGTFDAYWVGEIEAPTKGSHKTKLIDIRVNKLAAEVLVSNDLISDSDFDVLGYVSRAVGEKFAVKENAAFINGSGAGEPLGFLSDVDGDGPASVPSGSAAALTGDGIVNVYGALEEQYEPGAAWVMSKNTQILMELLTDGQDRYLIQSLLNGSLQSPMSTNIRGFQIFRDAAMPAVAANAYPIAFGDFGGYWVLDRVGVTVKFDKSNYISTDQTQIVAHKRVGGQLIEPWKLKVQKVETA